MKPYDYAARDGVLDLGWEDAIALAHRVAEELAARGVDLIVGNARAGLIPATVVACALRCDLQPVRLTRRERDRVVRETPAWLVPLEAAAVAGRRVAVVDEIADTGTTLALIAERARGLGAATVTTAVLVSHTWAAPAPDCAVMPSSSFPGTARY
jgi:uncharacterized protein